MCKVLEGPQAGEGTTRYRFVRCCARVPFFNGINIPWYAELGWRGSHIDPNGIQILLRDDVRKRTQFSISFHIPPGTPEDTIARLATTSGTRPCVYPDGSGVTFYWGAGKGCISASWLTRHAKAEGWKPDLSPRYVFAWYEACAGAINDARH